MPVVHKLSPELTFLKPHSLPNVGLKAQTHALTHSADQLGIAASCAAVAGHLHELSKAAYSDAEQT